MTADYIESPTQEIKFKDTFGISAKRLRYRLRILTSDRMKSPFIKAVVLKTVIKISTKYCYAAACGLLWSNWCEYKSSLGVEFGEYSLQQYRSAKEFSRLAAKEIEKL